MIIVITDFLTFVQPYAYCIFTFYIFDHFVTFFADVLIVRCNDFPVFFTYFFSANCTFHFFLPQNIIRIFWLFLLPFSLLFF